MSQNGAQGMAKEGMKYDEILKFFYEGVSIEDWE
jgi:SpoIID/LytB domain protein